MTANPDIGSDRRAQHRYNAACAASLAAAGRGLAEAAPDEAERVRLRGQVLEWLKAELKTWNRVSMTAEPGNKDLVAKALTHWKSDADLARVRAEKDLSHLSESTRKEWQALWNDVEKRLSKIHQRH